MRCREAQKKLTESHGIISNHPDHNELRSHVDNCLACTAFARAERILHNEIKAARANDTDGGLSLNETRHSVEKCLKHPAAPKPKGISIMKKISHTIKIRPRLSYSLAVAVAVFLIITLGPFNFGNKGGYEVAIAGINKNLAVDEARMDKLLQTFGMDGASYTVEGCSSTCKIKIYDLKTKDDVKTIIRVFDEMGNSKLDDVYLDNESKIVEFTTDGKNTLLLKRDDDIGTVVTQRLYSLGDDSTPFTIWVVKGTDYLITDSLANIEIVRPGDRFVWNRTKDPNGVILQYVEDSIQMGISTGDKGPDLYYLYNQEDKNRLTAITGDSIEKDDRGVTILIDNDRDTDRTIHINTDEINMNYSDIEYRINRDGNLQLIVFDEYGAEEILNMDDENFEQRLHDLGIEVIVKPESDYRIPK